MSSENKPYLIAEILLLRGLPINVIKEITALDVNEIKKIRQKCRLKKRSGRFLLIQRIL
ncbi:hypothetical protein SAMN05443252_104504 [Bacillus sp. OV322]|uniref:hypothetical protein n=1 Tax=Bacillus sp. OV322 TaxID=1882764 RepID=UPI0008F43714|nr:hypothetical protein [Bacillus sp. OV322]SFC59339.1 hypothetical protein SAMN05443252_104504 [Bacillus sp. OV322]